MRLSHPIVQCVEPEATSRGAALLALERIGAIPNTHAQRAQYGGVIQPIEKNAHLYRAALERQRGLYGKLFEESCSEHPIPDVRAAHRRSNFC